MGETELPRVDGQAENKPNQPANEEYNSKSLPRVILYGSSVAGNVAVKKKQTRIESIFMARKVAFEFVDVAADEEAKIYMQSKSSKTVLPQIFVDGEYKGGAEELEDANECEEVKLWLGVE